MTNLLRPPGMTSLRYSGMTVACVIAIALVFPVARAQAAGQVTGVILDENKSVVSGAAVRAVQTFSLSGALMPPIYTVSLADGTFQFAGLTAGTFRICATVAGGEFLDPCQWSDDPPTVNVGPEQVITGFRVQLTRGAFVHLDVQDPKRLLSKARDGKPVSPGLLFMGVRTERGRFFPVEQVVDNTDGARLYRILVPFQRSLKLQVFSTKIRVADDHDKTLSGKAPPQVFQLERGDKNKHFHFNVQDDGN